MVVGEIAESVDLLVVGAGPGGYVAAIHGAELGREVTVVDAGGPNGGRGGACLHVGCIPSKALIELAHARHTAVAMAPAGLDVGRADVDLERFQSWKDGIVERLDGDVGRLLDRHSIRYVTGRLRFNRPDRAAVQLPDGNVAFYEFEQAIIAVGSRPIALDVLPFDGQTILDSSDALNLTTVPTTLGIVGAGYIGLELGMAFARLGARVSIVETQDRILGGADEAVIKPLTRSLNEHGVELHLGCEAINQDDGTLRVHDSSGERQIDAEKVIVTIGRRPNTDDLGLDLAGVPVDAGGLIPVDDARRVSKRFSAIGDVTAGPPLAHKASAEAVVAAEALCGRPSVFDPIGIPCVVFTSPEIAWVGLSATEARTAGFEIEVGRVPLSASGRAATLSARDGFATTVAQRGTNRILGVQIVAPHASELISEATLALEMIATTVDLFGTVHPHPTLSESLHGSVAAVS